MNIMKKDNKKMKTTTFAIKMAGLGLGLALLASIAKAEDQGALFTMNNAATDNHALIFHRAANGAIAPVGSYATGGDGSGTGLPSQGSVLLSPNGHWLFVCNAGSDEISVFAVSHRGLILADKVSSGGRFPLSLALDHNLLYVLNAGGLTGGKDNIVGFAFAGGSLEALPNSSRALSGDNTGPAQISFAPDGKTLVVTERMSNLINTFTVGEDGLTTEHKTFQSVGATPFGFAVGRENLIFVSEAVGGMPNASSASSYSVSEEGELAVISGAVPTKQTAACWLTASRNGRFVYTANAGSGSISGFRVAHNGHLQLLDTDGQTALTGNGSHPTDMVESRGGRFFYSLNNGNGTISAFYSIPNGALHPLMVLPGLPTSASGLAGQ